MDEIRSYLENIDIVDADYCENLSDCFVSIPDMTDFQHRDILNIKEAAARAKAEGMNISEYTLRRIIRTGKIPCRIVGRTYLISWEKLMSWVNCVDGCDNRNWPQL